MKRYILADTSINAFIGLDGLKVTLEESADKALVFDERDNMPTKVKFYNALTGLNLESVEYRG